MLHKLEKATRLLMEIEKELNREINDLRDGGGESVPVWHHGSGGGGGGGDER